MVYPWIYEAEVATGIMLLVCALRVYARTKAVGFRGWCGDDYLILIAMLLKPYDIWYFVKVWNARGLGSKFFLGTITEGEKADLIEATKVNTFYWVTYVTGIWCFKGCMLFFYSRLTSMLPQYRIVKLAGLLCVITYISSILALLLYCRPLHKKWQLTPSPGRICATSIVNYFVVVPANFLTDALILGIAVPLLYSLRISRKRKLMVYLLLCPGIFIMIATLLRMAFGLISLYHPEVKTANGTAISFSFRESTVAAILVNAPCIKPLLFPGSLVMPNFMRAMPRPSVSWHRRPSTSGRRPSVSWRGRLSVSWRRPSAAQPILPFAKNSDATTTTTETHPASVTAVADRTVEFITDEKSLPTKIEPDIAVGKVEDIEATMVQSKNSE